MLLRADEMTQHFFGRGLADDNKMELCAPSRLRAFSQTYRTQHALQPPAPSGGKAAPLPECVQAAAAADEEEVLRVAEQDLLDTSLGGHLEDLQKAAGPLVEGDGLEMCEGQAGNVLGALCCRDARDLAARAHPHASRRTSNVTSEAGKL